MSQNEAVDLQYGKIVIEQGFATREQVKKGLRIQKRLSEDTVSPPRLGEILVEKGFLQKEEADKVARIQVQNSDVAEIPRYEIQKKLGEGGMGAVYKARQISLDRPVAIKVLDDRLKENRSFLQRFLREARSVAKLNHKHIIQGIDAGEYEGTYYFVMEYVKGRTLKEEIREKGKLGEERTVQISLQVAEALEHADQHNLIHRDIKPDNIMITEENRVKVCDLGLAKPRGEENQSMTITKTGTFIGTPYYMSPEQAKKKEDLDIRTDLYALGSTMYRLVTGELPFTGNSTTEILSNHMKEELTAPKEIDPDVSKEMNAIISKLMQKDPGDRYQKCEELITDLKRVQQGERPEHVDIPGSGYPMLESFFEVGRSSLKEHPVQLVLVGIGLVSLIGGMFFISGAFGKSSRKGNEVSQGKRSSAGNEEEVLPNSQIEEGKGTGAPEGGESGGQIQNTGEAEETLEAGNGERDETEQYEFHRLRRLVRKSGRIELSRATWVLKQIDVFLNDQTKQKWRERGRRLREKYVARTIHGYMHQTPDTVRDKKENKKNKDGNQERSEEPTDEPSDQDQKKQKRQQLIREVRVGWKKVRKLVQEGSFKKAREQLNTLKRKIPEDFQGDLREKLATADEKLTKKWRREKKKQDRVRFKEFVKRFERTVRLWKQSTLSSGFGKQAEKLIEETGEKMNLEAYRRKVGPFRKDIGALRDFGGRLLKRGLERIIEEDQQYYLRIRNFEGTLFDYSGNTVTVAGEGGDVQVGGQLGEISMMDRYRIAARVAREDHGANDWMMGVYCFHAAEDLIGKTEEAERRKERVDQARKFLNKSESHFQGISKPYSVRSEYYLKRISALRAELEKQLTDFDRSGKEGEKQGRDGSGKILKRVDNIHFEEMLNGNILEKTAESIRVRYEGMSKKQFQDWNTNPTFPLKKHFKQNSVVLAPDNAPASGIQHQLKFDGRSRIQLVAEYRNKPFGTILMKSLKGRDGYSAGFGVGKRGGLRSGNLAILKTGRLENLVMKKMLDKHVLKIKRGKRFAIRATFDREKTPSIRISIKGQEQADFQEILSSKATGRTRGFSAMFFLGPVRIYRVTVGGRIDQEWLKSIREEQNPLNSK